MPTDPLENLLRQTDAIYPASTTTAAGLVNGAHRAHRRNRRRRQIATTACVLSACSVALFSLDRQHARRPALVHVDDKVQVQSDIGELDLALANQKRLVETMQRAEGAQAAERQLKRLPTVDAIQKLDDERERIALVILHQAASAPSGAPARAIYQQVTQDFPGTGAATVAEQYLIQVR